MSTESESILATKLVGMEKIHTLIKMPPKLVTTSHELTTNFSFNSLPRHVRMSSARERPRIHDNHKNRIPTASPSKDLITNVLMEKNRSATI